MPGAVVSVIFDVYFLFNEIERRLAFVQDPFVVFMCTSALWLLLLPTGQPRGGL